MKQDLRALAAAGALLALFVGTALAQKPGGILRIGHFDSPPSVSMIEGSSAVVNRPMMGVFNNLIMYDQHVRQNSSKSIVPDLTTSWSWNEEGTELTLPLRRGVKWHDGKRFTAKDVKCTWDLLTGKSSEKLRLNPRGSWYTNLDEVTETGDYEVTFHLKRPQPSFLALLATGWSPVYPCHVSPRDMRTHPIGTGPFKFVEFKPNQSITVTKNPDYWKESRPYLDGIEWTITKEVSTRLLAFIAGKTDFYPAVTIPQLKDVRSQAPQAICEIYSANVSRNLIANRHARPFDNLDLRRAMTLSLDRKGVQRHPRRGAGRHRRGHAAAAQRAVGNAAGDIADAAGLRSRRPEEPRPSARHHGKARLRTRQETRSHCIDPQRPPGIAIRR
jgi:peptide/nickel transport system substrate-binding protein